MSKSEHLPAMPFYIGDWMKAPEVRSLQPDYRGLYIDLICFMWESPERGVLVNQNNRPYTDDEIIRMVGLDNQNTSKWLTVLLENGCVFRREEDNAICNARMIRDEKLRITRKIVGSLGGNPSLNKKLDNQKDNQNTEDENGIEDEDVNNTESKKEKLKIKKPEWAANFKNYDPSLVYPFEDEKFGKVWDLWIDFRKEKHLSSYKTIGHQAALRKISNISVTTEQAKEIIFQSIENNWTGLFELKTKTNGNPTAKKGTGGISHLSEDFLRSIHDALHPSEVHPPDARD